MIRLVIGNRFAQLGCFAGTTFCYVYNWEHVLRYYFRSSSFKAPLQVSSRNSHKVWVGTLVLWLWKIPFQLHPQILNIAESRSSTFEQKGRRSVSEHGFYWWVKRLLPTWSISKHMDVSALNSADFYHWTPMTYFKISSNQDQSIIWDNVQRLLYTFEK